MSVLNKHKKNGLDGFKNFVRSLESMSIKAQKKTVQLAVLEDPVYFTAALSNVVSFKYLLELDAQERQKLINHMPTGLQSMQFALVGQPEEKIFLDGLDEQLLRKYKENTEYASVPNVAQKLTARNKMIEAMRELQEGQALSEFNWTIPNEKILHGTYFEHAEPNGKFTLYYDTKDIALDGQFENKIRVDEWKHYYPNAQLLAVGVYLSGEKNGPWLFYYSDGKIKSSGEYKDDLKDGKWEEYSKDGIMTHAQYENGKLVT